MKTHSAREARPALPPLTREDVGEILISVPCRPPYAEWLRIISAVASVLSEHEAVELLSAWSPEERPGEYARKLRSSLKGIGIGSLIALAKSHGFDASEFARRRALRLTHRPVAIVPARHDNVVITMPTAKKLPSYTLRHGTAADLDELAKLRGLRTALGLDMMQAAGCLAFADDLADIDDTGCWRPVRSWFVLDSTRRNVSARRLDGLPWQCCGGQKSRCVSGPSSKHWPIGLNSAKPGQRLDVVEGEGDFLTLWHLHAKAGKHDAIPVGLLGAGVDLEHYAAEVSPHVQGRDVLLFPHLDENKTGQRAIKLWSDSFYRLGAKNVRARDLTPWLGGVGKDLNDAVNRDANLRHKTPPPGFCAQCWERGVIATINGPTCRHSEWTWPEQSSETVAGQIGGVA